MYIIYMCDWTGQVISSFYLSLHSGASVHNGEYEEEVEDAKELTVEQAQENDAVMNKMKSLRAKMENLTLVKKVRYNSKQDGS